MNELLTLDFTLDPTFNIYEANRDLMRARRAEWHEDYTLPSLWKFYEPSRQFAWFLLASAGELNRKWMERKLSLVDDIYKRIQKPWRPSDGGN